MYFLDGDRICCVYKDFINLQESPAGFGKTNKEALENLKKDSKKQKRKAK